MKGQPKSPQKHYDEKDIDCFLKESKNNMIVVLGQKVNLCHRTEIVANAKNKDFQYIDKDGNMYYQILGRHAVNQKGLDLLVNPSYAIFNISTLIDVKKMKTHKDSTYYPRSFYDVEAYKRDDYR